MVAKPKLENYERSIFNFDMIRICSKRSPEELKEILLVEDFKHIASSFIVDTAYNSARKAGYKTRIEFVNPTDVCLQRLLFFEKDLHSYSITYVEIGKDDLYQEVDPNGIHMSPQTDSKWYPQFPIGDHFVGEIWRTLNKKWNTSMLDYRQERFDSLERNPEKGSITLYYGTLFELVVYPRKSKTTGTPCVHWELLTVAHMAPFRGRLNGPTSGSG